MQVVELLAVGADAKCVECRAHCAGVLNHCGEDAALGGHGAHKVLAGFGAVPAVSPHIALVALTILEVDDESAFVLSVGVAGPMLDAVPFHPVDIFGRLCLNEHRRREGGDSHKLFSHDWFVFMWLS